jgi:hypothetical protein
MSQEWTDLKLVAGAGFESAAAKAMADKPAIPLSGIKSPGQ